MIEGEIRGNERLQVVGGGWRTAVEYECVEERGWMISLGTRENTSLYMKDSEVIL